MDPRDGRRNPEAHTGAGPRRLTHRDRAILRAVGRGGAELVLGAEPDLYLDGRCCSDQMAAHELVHRRLIVPAAPGGVGQRVAARLSAAGSALTDPAAGRLAAIA